MNDELIDIRRPLAVSRNTRVELGQDGTVHVLAGPITLHVERAFCEELTTTLARAMVRLVQEREGAGGSKRPPDSRHLRVVVMQHGAEPDAGDPFIPDDRAAAPIDTSYEDRLSESQGGTESSATGFTLEKGTT